MANRLLPRLRFVLSLFFVAALVCADEGPKPVSNALVSIQAGNAPIIISAPHGGAGTVPDVPERKGEGLTKGGSGFVAARDTGTEELAAAIAKSIEAQLG